MKYTLALSVFCLCSHVEKLAEDPVVKYVEPNQIVRSKQEMCIQQRNAEWVGDFLS